MGLFDRKKKTGFELPEKLEMLLEIAIKDGVVSEKEPSVFRAEVPALKTKDIGYKGY
mgnify:FL=1